jgi:hypothetical protein
MPARHRSSNSAILEKLNRMEAYLKAFILLSIFSFLFISITMLCYYSVLVGEKNFYRERKEILQQVTGKEMFRGCNETATFFGFYYQDYVADVTVSHILCDPNITHLLECSAVDLALVPRCPIIGALNGRISTEIVVGDQVFAYGFGEYSSAWGGMLTGIFGKNETSFAPFQGHSNLPPDAHIFLGDQHSGMSGAAVLNAYGLVDVAVSYVKIDKRLVGVVPVSYLIKCFSHYASMGKLPKIHNCADTMVINPTVSFGIKDTFFRIFKWLKRMANGIMI